MHVSDGSDFNNYGPNKIGLSDWQAVIADLEAEMQYILRSSEDRGGTGQKLLGRIWYIENKAIIDDEVELFAKFPKMLFEIVETCRKWADKYDWVFIEGV